MILTKVYNFLTSLPYAKESSDSSQILVRCPFCGDSEKHNDSTHFSIKIETNNKEPLLYQCFQPSSKCGAKGILTADVLQKLGCNDMSVLLELSAYNKTISKSLDKFSGRRKKEYRIFNMHNSVNKRKIKYINARLGLELEPADLKKLKIQLSLYDYLKINSIKDLAFNERYCNALNEYTIGFISMYDDYIICRDITKEKLMKKRYINYSIRGTSDILDTKIYTIPTEIDLLSPKPTIINVAEGAFSILGVYHGTNIDRYNDNNKIFSANCGTGYYGTISSLCRQYGLTNNIINIFSDSEIPVKEYEKLYRRLIKHMNIVEFKVIYNEKKEDFGYPANEIKPNILNLTK